jgi:hypothetical protein
MFNRVASTGGTAALVMGALLGIASPANAETNPNRSRVDHGVSTSGGLEWSNGEGSAATDRRC